jgi:hypothetical protein
MRNSFWLMVVLSAAPPPSGVLSCARGGRGRRAVKAYGLFPARVGLDPGNEEETDLLTLDATPLIYALLNAVRELTARVEALEGHGGK